MLFQKLRVDRIVYKKHKLSKLHNIIFQRHRPLSRLVETRVVASRPRVIGVRQNQGRRDREVNMVPA